MTSYAENTADQTDHFADAFVCENVLYCYDTGDVMSFESWQSTPFCFREILCTKKNILMF